MGKKRRCTHARTCNVVNAVGAPRDVQNGMRGARHERQIGRGEAISARVLAAERLHQMRVEPRVVEADAQGEVLPVANVIAKSLNADELALVVRVECVVHDVVIHIRLRCWRRWARAPAPWAAGRA